MASSDYETKNTPGQVLEPYRGWRLWYHGEHPATGRFRASRFGVEHHAGTIELLKRQIDMRIEEHPEYGRE